MTSALDRPIRVLGLDRPLLVLAALMAVTAVVSGVLAIVDPIEIVGRNGWLKPGRAP